MSFSLSNEDVNFQQQVESCVMPVADFNHRAHLRLAYIYLSNCSVNIANQRVNQALHALLKHNNIEVSAKYHETLTQAWLLAVNHFMQQGVTALSANALIDKFPQLLDSNMMLNHYSAECLYSDKARAAFIEPDLEPFPSY